MRTLKPLTFLLLSTLATASVAEEAIKIQPERAETLDPEDIGIAKYVFEASPPAGKVMVLRQTHDRADGVAWFVTESISYTDGKKEREVVLVFDPSKFPFNRDRAKPGDCELRAQGGNMWFSKKQLKSWGYVGKKLSFTFSNDKGEKDTVTFECFIEDYASAKARIPDLPAEAPGGGWGYNHLISPSKEK